jgi:hypothetical protein
LVDLNLDSEYSIELYKKYRLILLPGRSRNDVVEYLLEQYEPGIVNDCNGNLVVCLKQLGLLSDGLKTDLNQVVGLHDSVQLFAKLILLTQYKSKVDDGDTISYIAQNAY